MPSSSWDAWLTMKLKLTSCETLTPEAYLRPLAICDYVPAMIGIFGNQCILSDPVANGPVEVHSRSSVPGY